MKWLEIVVALAALSRGVWALSVANSDSWHVRDDAKPNIVLIIADDLLPDKVRAYGNPYFADYRVTPWLDQLAMESVRFDTAITASPLCAPSRFAIVTGQYNSRRIRYETSPVPSNLTALGAEPSALYYVEQKPVRPATVKAYENRSMGALLKGSGYATGAFGKWHLGNLGMNNRSYDYTYVFSNNPKCGMTSTPEFLRNPEFPIHNPEEVTFEAIDFMSRAVSRKVPFFAHVAYTLPHDPNDMSVLLSQDPFTGQEPFLPGQETSSRNAHRNVSGMRPLKVSDDRREEILRGRKELWQQLDKEGLLYARQQEPSQRGLGALAWLDQQVGKIMGHLDHLGVGDNSLIVFTADHGIVPHPEVGKGSPFNEGIRVPLLVRWRSVLPEMRAIDTPVSLLDLLPTFIEASGNTKAPPDLDGRSLLTLMVEEGPIHELDHRPIFVEVGVSRTVLANEWKLIVIRNEDQVARTDHGCSLAYSLMVDGGDTGLYDQYFCHRALCGRALQLYRYRHGCEQEELSAEEPEHTDKMLELVQQHIWRTEQCAGCDRPLKLDQEGTTLDEASPVPERVSAHDTHGRVGCYDGRLAPSTSYGTTHGCDLRYHTLWPQ